MTDVFDRAQERENELRQDALDAHKRRTESAGSVSTDVCRCCEGAIPAARRKALPGVTTCIECQNDIERFGHHAWGDTQ